MKLNKSHVLPFLRLASELAEKLPIPGDSWLNIGVKSIAMFDSVYRVFYGRRSTYDDLHHRYKLVERTSPPFVRLFFGTKMVEGFQIVRSAVDEYLELIEAVLPDGERLIFQEHRYGRPEISDTFFYTPGFDFSAAIETLWKSCPGGLYLSRKDGRHGREAEFAFSAMRKSEADLSSKAMARVMAHGIECRLEPTCCVALGPPGTGKTSFAMELAAFLGGRLLKVDAVALAALDLDDLDFILTTLAPRVLLIDDFDRAPKDAATARVLYLFELLAAHPVAVVVTINKIEGLDGALFRGSRIGTVLDFDLPDADERRQLVERFVATMMWGTTGGEAMVRETAIGRDELKVETVVAMTDGFNQDDIQKLLQRLRREPLEVALARTMRLRELAAQTSASAPGEGDTKPASPAPSQPG
jgi:hypothetical protein